MALKVRAKHRTMDKEVVAKQAHTEGVEHTAQIGLLECVVLELKGKLCL